MLKVTNYIGRSYFILQLTYGRLSEDIVVRGNYWRKRTMRTERFKKLNFKNHLPKENGFLCLV